MHATDPRRPSNPAQRSAEPPQRQMDQRNPGKTAASLTCLLFIRRTSSRKSIDSMVRWRTRQPAAKKKRQNHREEPLPHGPDSQWTGPPRRLHFRFRGGSKRNPAPSLQRPDKERLASPENGPRAWPCHGRISRADLRRPRTRQSPLSVLSPRLLVEAMTLG